MADGFRRVAPGLVPHLLVSALAFYWYQSVLAEWGMFDRGPGLLTSVHMKTLAAFVPLVLLSYAKLLVFPYQYSIRYPLPSVSVPVGLAESVGSFVFMGFLLAAGVYLWRKRRDLFFFYSVFFVLLAPYLNIVYIGIWVANRYLYLSVFCVAAILVAVGLDLFDRGVRAVRIAVVTFFVAFMTINAIQSVSLQNVWRDNYSLWTYEVEYLKNPSLLAIQALAKHFVKTGEAASGSDEKRHYAGKADELIARGMNRFESLDYVRTDYATDEEFYYARFFHLKGRVASLKGGHPLTALSYYEKAYDINPGDGANTFYVAKLHKYLALHSEGSVSISHARRSLDAFAQFVRLKSVDLVWKGRILAGLDGYEKDFEYMKQEVANVREQYSGSFP
jgi:hypothetical protein